MVDSEGKNILLGGFAPIYADTRYETAVELKEREKKKKEGKDRWISVDLGFPNYILKTKNEDKKKTKTKNQLDVFFCSTNYSKKIPSFSLMLKIDNREKTRLRLSILAWIEPHRKYQLSR